VLQSDIREVMARITRTLFGTAKFLNRADTDNLNEFSSILHNPHLCSSKDHIVSETQRRVLKQPLLLFLQIYLKDNQAALLIGCTARVELSRNPCKLPDKIFAHDRRHIMCNAISTPVYLKLNVLQVSLVISTMLNTSGDRISEIFSWKGF
jgi:hypothetical protein